MRQQSVVTLDPISQTRKKQDSVMGRLFKTRHFAGKSIKKEIPYGHYMFCGKQGGGKTLSALWYMEFLKKKFEKQGWKIENIYSNVPLNITCKPISKAVLFPTIYNMPAYNRTDKIINFIFIDEIQSYFPKDFADRQTKDMIGQLVGCFSQLRKRHIFLLSTAQVYGRLDKNLREQCLYMVNCRKSKITNRIVNDFIDGDDVMCDDLGRWSGIASKIYVHGLPKIKYDSSYLIKN